MDGVALARASQLKAFTSAISKESLPQLSTARAADICQALVASRLVAEAALKTASNSRRNEAVQAVDAWFTALVKALQQAEQVSQQQQLTRLLAASATVCDTPRLLLCYQQWLPLLLDLLKSQRDALLQQLEGGRPAAEAAGGDPVEGKQQPSRKRPHALVSGGQDGEASSPATIQLLTGAVRTTCEAATHVFTRLGDVMEVGGVRREASALASRACGLVLPLATLQGRAGAGAATPALQLLARLMDVAPASLRNHATALKTAFATAIVGAGGSGGMVMAGGRGSQQAAAAACLAALPRVAGDAATYSDLYRQLLLSLHDVLDVMLMGLDDPAAAAACRGVLTVMSSSSTAVTAAGATQANGQHQHKAAGAKGKGNVVETTGAAGGAAAGPLLPLTGLLGGVEGGGAGGAQRRVHGPTVRALGEVALTGLEAARQLLVGAYPTPVPLPCGPILHLASRLLRFNDSTILASGRVPPSAAGFQQLQAALPALHASATRLLRALVLAAGPVMLPLHASLGRLLCDQLRRLRGLGPGAAAAVSGTGRAALYRLAVAACEAPGGGAAVARAIAADALGAATVELYGWTPDGGAAVAAQGAGGAGALLHGPQGGKPASKKQRLTEAVEATAGAGAAAAAAAAAAGPAGCFAAGSSAAVAAAAALQLLAAVVGVAGPLLPAAARAGADTLAYHLAVTAGEAALLTEHEPTAVTALQAAGLGALRAQALRTLLVTLVTPLATRPPYLSQALELFSQGCNSRCVPVAEASRAATASLEALLHPRATPITGVRQAYAGMSEVVPLPRPQLWSALQHGHIPADSALGQLKHAQLLAAAEEQQATARAAASASGAAPAPAASAVPGPSSSGAPDVVMGFPVQAPVAHMGGTAVPHDGAIAAGSSVGVVRQAVDAGARVRSSPLGPRAGAAGVVLTPSALIDSDAVGGAGAALTKEGAAVHAAASSSRALPDSQRGARSGTEVVAGGGAGQPAPATRPAERGSASVAAVADASAAFGPESSDSEGSLPDIDMGGESEKSEDSDE